MDRITIVGIVEEVFSSLLPSERFSKKKKRGKCRENWMVLRCRMHRSTHHRKAPSRRYGNGELTDDFLRDSNVIAIGFCLIDCESDEWWDKKWVNGYEDIRLTCGGTGTLVTSTLSNVRVVILIRSAKIRNMTNKIKWEWEVNAGTRTQRLVEIKSILDDDSCHYNNAIRSQQLVDVSTWNLLTKVLGRLSTLADNLNSSLNDGDSHGLFIDVKNVNCDTVWVEVYNCRKKWKTRCVQGSIASLAGKYRVDFGCCCSNAMNSYHRRVCCAALRNKASHNDVAV